MNHTGMPDASHAAEPGDHARQAAGSGQPATVAELRSWIRLQADQAIATSLVLTQQCRAITAASTAMLAASDQLHQQLWIDWARRRAQRQRHGDPDEPLWFVLRGLIDGRLVRGAWAAGHLRCDPLLEARARFLVQLEESFVFEDPPCCLAASLEQPPMAVALTLTRACDRVLDVYLGTPGSLDGTARG